MSTLLRYGVKTDPLPLQASPKEGPQSRASLTIVVSNPNPDLVKLQSLVVKLPIGGAATDLSADSKSIGAVAPLNWKCESPAESAGEVRYTFQPDPGHESVGQSGLEISFHGIQVNRQPGTFQVTVVEGSGGCDVSTNCPQYDEEVTKFPNGWGQVQFWGNLAIVDYDKPQLYLQWDGPADATYAIEYVQGEKKVVIPSKGQPPLPNAGQLPAAKDPGLALQESTPFTLHVSETIGGQCYNAYPQWDVKVKSPRPKIYSFGADPISVGAKTGSTTLKWKAESTDDFKIDGEAHFEGQRALSGTYAKDSVEPLQHFTATAAVLPGVTGPPATATAVVGVQGTAKTDKMTLKIDGNTVLIIKETKTGSIDPSSGGKVDTSDTATLPTGVTAALLQPADKTNYDAILRASFETALQKSLLYSGVFIQQGGGINPPITDNSWPENVGVTWALKVTDKRLIVLTYKTSDGFVFEFEYIDYGELSGQSR